MLVFRNILRTYYMNDPYTNCFNPLNTISHRYINNKRTHLVFLFPVFWGFVRRWDMVTARSRGSSWHHVFSKHTLTSFVRPSKSRQNIGFRTSGCGLNGKYNESTYQCHWSLYKLKEYDIIIKTTKGARHVAQVKLFYWIWICTSAMPASGIE